MKQWVLLIMNSVTLLFTLLMNYLTVAGELTGATVGEISARYENLFTPAGYAFSIWGIIYMGMLGFLGYQWYAWIKDRNDEYLRRTGIWFIMSNISNGAWIIAWTSDYIGLSFFLILTLLFSLLMLMFRLRLEIWDAPVRIIAFVWWPVCIYLGWIVAATMANLAAYSVSLKPDDAFALHAEWVILQIAAASVIYLLLIYYRNMREAALTGVWALVAISVKQWHFTQSVAYAAIIASFILLIYAFAHAIRNKETSPLNKIKRGEI
jgi:hypothetical protein